MNEKKLDNVVYFDKYRKPKEEIEMAFQEIATLAKKQIGTDKESEYKWLTQLYRVVLSRIATEFDPQYDAGPPGYDTEHNSMVIFFGPFKDFGAFLDFVKERLYLIPNELREHITVYLMEHDNALDSYAAKIDAKGMEIIKDPEKVPFHEESSLDYKRTDEDTQDDNELLRLRNLRSDLLKKLSKIKFE